MSYPSASVDCQQKTIKNAISMRGQIICCSGFEYCSEILATVNMAAQCWHRSANYGPWATCGLNEICKWLGGQQIDRFRALSKRLWQKVGLRTKVQQQSYQRSPCWWAHTLHWLLYCLVCRHASKAYRSLLLWETYKWNVADVWEDLLSWKLLKWAEMSWFLPFR